MAFKDEKRVDHFVQGLAVLLEGNFLGIHQIRGTDADTVSCVSGSNG
jgi:hypothetical protein